MRFSLAVLLLAACCLADVILAEETKTPSASVSMIASLRSKRMIGGALAPHVPWQAMIFLSDNFMEGGYASGALISDRWILTAGRNLFVQRTRQDTRGVTPLTPKVFLGITGRPEADESIQRAVEKIVLHPGFQNHTDWDNDLALIQLKEPVVISDKIIPIPLPQGNNNLSGGVIAGWGWGMYLSQAQSLKHMVLPLADQSRCKSEFNGRVHKPVVDDNMFCTSSPGFSHNVCQGDAGGALVASDPDTGDVYAVGILSYDKPCSNSEFAVYMKISSYLPWIHSVIRGDTESSAAQRSEAMSKMLAVLHLA